MQLKPGTEKKRSKLTPLIWNVMPQILGISRKDKICNDCICKQLGLETSIMDRIQKRQLAYYEHTIRMDNCRLPLITIDGIMKGTRPRGRPPKRWTDSCKKSCQARGLASLLEARRFTQDRLSWRTFICSNHLDRA